MDESEDAGARSGVVDKSSAGDLTVAVAAGDPTASCSGPDEGIDDMFNHLELNDDEPDDVVISIDEAREYQQAARWLAIGNVHTNRSFSADALFEKMKVVWNFSRDPIFCEAGENIFIFQMHFLGDWKKWCIKGLELSVDGVCSLKIIMVWANQRNLFSVVSMFGRKFTVFESSIVNMRF
jgi:hypothetical protein